MKTYELDLDDNLKTVNVPNSWDDVTVEMFIKLIKKTDELKEVQMTDLESLCIFMSILIGIDSDELDLMDMSLFNNISQDISFFFNEQIPQLKRESITINDEEYFLKTDFNDLTMGEMISIDILQKENMFYNIDKLLCIFLRKKKENGKLEKFKNEFMQRDFRHVKIVDVYTLFSFFQNGEVIS